VGVTIVQTAISAFGGMIIIYAIYFLSKKTTSWLDNRERKRIAKLPLSEQTDALNKYEEKLAKGKKRELILLWLLLFLMLGLPLILALFL
jgi:hypothetical protein